MSKHHTKNWIRKDKRLAIYMRDGMACAYCGKGVDDEGTRLSLDHLVCRSHGGSNMEGNLITCCLSCNSSRADTLLADWLILKCGNNAAATARYITSHTGLDLKPFRKEAKLILARRKAEQASRGK